MANYVFRWSTSDADGASVVVRDANGDVVASGVIADTTGVSNEAVVSFTADLPGGSTYTATATVDGRSRTAIGVPELPTLESLTATIEAADRALAPKLFVKSLPPRTSIVTRFQSGHGWTVSGGTTNDANHPLAVMGTQAVYQVSNGTGSLTTLSKGTLALDLTANDLALTFMCENPETLNAIFLYAGDATFANAYLWRVDFNGTMVNKRFSAYEWVTIPLNLADAIVLAGTPTPANITTLSVRFQDLNAANGNANKPTRMHFQEVALLAKQTTYPNGVLTICADDGHQSVSQYLVPACTSRGIPLTAYTIADRIGVTGFQTHADLEAIETAGGEVAAHAYTLAAHDARFTSLTDQQLDDELAQLKQWLVRYGYSGADLIAYPGGMWNDRVLAAVRRYFSYGRHLSAGNNLKAETLPPGDRYRGQAMSDLSTHASGVSEANVKAYIDRVKAHKAWGQITFHQLVTGTPANNIQCSTTMMNSVLDYAAASGVALRTASQALRGV